MLCTYFTNFKGMPFMNIYYYGDIHHGLPYITWMDDLYTNKQQTHLNLKRTKWKYMPVDLWFNLRPSTGSRLTFDRSSDIIRQEFRQTAGLEMVQGSQCGWSWTVYLASFVILFFSVCVLFLFSVSFCLVCTCQLAYPMTLMLCPVQSQWIVLLY